MHVGKQYITSACGISDLVDSMWDLHICGVDKPTFHLSRLFAYQFNNNPSQAYTYVHTL